MNDLSLLMHLLSMKRDSNLIGASKKELIENLGIKGKNSSVYLQKLIIELSNYLEPIGLQVRYNPLNSYWFITFESEISELLLANPFERRPSLAATLFCVIVYCLKSSGSAEIADIQKIRGKKSIIEDIKELEGLGYLEIISKSNQVRLTPLIGYKLDIPKLLLQTALKIKD